MQSNRYDRATIKASRTDEGYLIDTPVVGRIGIQIYRNADGSIRRELRLPDDVFNQDSLASFSSKPITDDHPSEPVTSKNAKLLTVGFMSAGKQDGNNVVAQVTIHDADVIDKIENGGKRELSLGYKVDLEETAGVWEGQEYDAIQRNIRINHLAIVKQGRAGNARLNIDALESIGADEDFLNQHKEDDMADTMGRLRLDSGLEYQAAPEVIVAFEQIKKDTIELKQQLSTLKADSDKVAAERDLLKGQVADVEKIKADAMALARSEVKARNDLELAVADLKIDCAGKTDRQVKELAIKSVRADLILDGKSDDYIDAAFDMALANHKDVGEKMADQRKKTAPSESKSDEKDAYGNFMKKLGKKESK